MPNKAVKRERRVELDQAEVQKQGYKDHNREFKESASISIDRSHGDLVMEVYK